MVVNLDVCYIVEGQGKGPVLHHRAHGDFGCGCGWSRMDKVVACGGGEG